jgi:hypothetical protein
MAASIEIRSGGPIPPEESIFRALNPKHLENGLPGDNHFVMKQNHEIGDGVSTGVVSLVSLSELRSIEALVQLCGERFGVAELSISEALAPVAPLGICVLQQDDLAWGAFSGAHAVITGYQSLKGNDGRRKIREYQRHLVKLARKRYYPQGSDSAVSIDVT